MTQNRKALFRKPPENILSAEEQADLDKNLSSWMQNMEENEKNLKEEDKKENIINNTKSEKEKEAGNDYLRSKDYDMALECYTRSIDYNNKNAAAYFNRALVYLKQKKHQKALEDCDQAISIKNDYIKAYHRRAQIYIELKEYDKAIPDLEKVLAKYPENNEANSELKKCRTEARKITGYRRINIVEADDDDEEEEEEKKEEDDEENEENEEILKKEPKVRELSDSEIAKLEDEENANQQALKSIQKKENLKDFIKEIEEIKVKGNEYFKQEDYDSAITEFNRAILSIENSYSEQQLLLETTLLPLVIHLHNNRALAYSKLDCNNEAIQDSLKVLKLDGNNIKALFRMGKCQAHRNNFKEAAKSLKKILDIDPNNGVAKREYEEYIHKDEEANNIMTKCLSPKRSSFIDKSSIKDFENIESTSASVLERRVSFREEDAKEQHPPKKYAKDIFKRLEAKFKKVKIESDEDGENKNSEDNPTVMNNEPIEEVKRNTEKNTEEDKLEMPLEKKSKKNIPVQISQETINNAKEIASKLGNSLEVPTSALMFETAAKSLKNNQAQFYDYLKVLFI